jgi:hypothetical protein
LRSKTALERGGAAYETAFYGKNHPVFWFPALPLLIFLIPGIIQAPAARL